MHLEPGMIVVIGAVLIFYLRLIILQRERVRQVRRATLTRTKKNKNKSKYSSPEQTPGFSLFVSNRRDQVIGVIGLLVIVTGLLLYTGKPPFPNLQTYWWIPTAAGIIAFSFLFKL